MMAMEENIALRTNVELEIVHAIRSRVRLRLKRNDRLKFLKRIDEFTTAKGHRYGPNQTNQ